MATKIADIIEPVVFASYVTAKTTYLSNLINSGLAKNDERLSKLVSGGGRTINMPIWNRLGGDSEVLSDVNPLSVDKITTSQDIATIHLRGKAWGANELASNIAGASAINAIGNQVAEYWVREEQKIFIKTIKGVFASPSMSGHVLDENTQNISAKIVLKAKQLLGDASTQLSALIVHSATYTELQTQNLIVYIPDSEGRINIPTYLGYRVIIDDTTPIDAGNVYNSYLFSFGSFGRGDGTPVDFTGVETARDGLLGEDYLIYRRAFVLHPVGIAWVGNAVETTPTNAELEAGASWNRVYDSKLIGMINIKHKIG